MKLYFRQEMVYHYDINKPMDDFPAYFIAMGEHEGYTFYVKNINGRHPTAYVGVPEGHPLYGEYLTDKIPLEVHGGVTYAEAGLYYVAGSEWFIGWDYGHAGDYAPYYEKGEYLEVHSRKWSVDEIIDECVSACEQLKRLEK